MAKYITFPCTNSACVAQSDSWRGGLTSHRMLGQADLGQERVQCEECGTVSNRTPPLRTRNPKKRTWPYYNDSTGVTFESESHEQKYVKENKLEAV